MITHGWLERWKRFQLAAKTIGAAGRMVVSTPAAAAVKIEVVEFPLPKYRIEILVRFSVLIAADQ